MKNLNTKLWTNSIGGGTVLEPCFRQLSGIIERPKDLLDKIQL